MADIEDLARNKYVQLVTFRRDGREVATPVWCVAEGGKLYFYSERDAGKAKRIRAGGAEGGRVRLAPCTSAGARLLGPWREGRAREVTSARRAGEVMALMARKYGWLYRVLTAVAWLGRKVGRRAVFEIEMQPSGA